MATWKHSLFQVHQVLVTVCKDLARRINIINGKSINSIYTAPTAKDGKTYDFIDSEYKAQDVTIFDDIDATFDSEFFLYLIRTTSEFLQKYTNKAWVSAIITKASKIRSGLRGSKSIIRIWGEGQRGPRSTS